MFTIKAFRGEDQNTYEAISYKIGGEYGVSENGSATLFYFKDPNGKKEYGEIHLTHSNYQAGGCRNTEFEGCADRIIVENSNGKTTDIFKASEDPNIQKD